MLVKTLRRTGKITEIKLNNSIIIIRVKVVLKPTKSMKNGEHWKIEEALFLCGTNIVEEAKGDLRVQYLPAVLVILPYSCAVW